MYLKADKYELYEQILKVSKVSPVRTSMPILNCILMTLKGNTLSLRSSDIEITMNVDMEVNGIEDGSVAVPSRLFTEIVGELEPGILSIKADYEGLVKITTERGKYEIMGRSPDEFPSLPNVNILHEIEFDSEILNRIIRKTIFAVARDELKPALIGVLFQFKNKELRTVSTDGHRLICLKRFDINKEDFEKDIIIPKKFLNVLQSYLKDGEKIVLSIGDNHVKASIDNAIIFSRLINEHFPDYESVVPVDNDKVLKTSVEEFYSTIKRVSIFSNKTTHQVVLNLNPDVSLKMKAYDEENRSSAEEEFDGEYSGDPINIGFNSEYLKELLRNIDSPKFNFKFKTPTSATILEPDENTDGEELFMLLMPIRLVED
ncbi:MAG: DNA polymerase III subunit beta [Candidatus Marinimicrobia bacterium]|nr:DNA polymerase III subunit beta [Candidatus Neomarinimicrobiota bacterium]